MKKISDRFRKTLRAVFRAIGVSVISLIIQACYGPPPVAHDLPPSAYEPPPPKERIRFSGTVMENKTDKPIKGIQISVEESGDFVLTNENGSFVLSVPSLEKYTLIIKDIDGQDNGGLFKEEKRKLNKDDIDTYHRIGMDIDTETR